MNIAVVGERAFMRTFDVAWKIKRIRTNSEVEIAPSTVIGKPTGPTICRLKKQKWIVGTFGYSNANYDALGLIVQAVSGQSYEDYVRHHIFAPLEMQQSFVSQDEAMRHGMAQGHRWWFGIPVPVTLPYHRAELPAGFIISGAEDMAHFVIALSE